MLSVPVTSSRSASLRSRIKFLWPFEFETWVKKTLLLTNAMQGMHWDQRKVPSNYTVNFKLKALLHLLLILTSFLTLYSTLHFEIHFIWCIKTLHRTYFLCSPSLLFSRQSLLPASKLPVVKWNWQKPDRSLPLVVILGERHHHHMSQCMWWEK